MVKKTKQAGAVLLPPVNINMLRLGVEENALPITVKTVPLRPPVKLGLGTVSELPPPNRDTIVGRNETVTFCVLFSPLVETKTFHGIASAPLPMKK